MSIPQFPKFKKLSLEDKNEITDFVKDYPPYSDFNFVSLWSFDTENDIIISRLNGNLVVRLRDYITNEPFLTFLGQHQVKKTVQTLIDYAEKSGLSPVLKLIPEITIQSVPNLKRYFNVSEDRNNFDYITSTTDLSQLKGTRFHSKSKLIRKFIKSYPDYHIDELDPKDKKQHSLILDLFYAWERKKGKKRADTEHELTAIKRLLKNAHHFKLLILGVHHQGKMIGFLISEIIHNKHSIGHFMKTDPNYKGVTELIHKHHSQILLEKDSLYFNFEQDLGLAGLRQSKTLWRPTHFLKKYTIQLKTKSLKNNHTNNNKKNTN
jgi:hypothetical protein